MIANARDFECAFTGQPADELHHPTGRNAAGRYLDPDFVLPTVRRQHNLEHQSWGPSYKETVVDDPDVLRLRRTGHLLIRLGEHRTGASVELPAAFAVALGLMLHQIADRSGEVS